MHNELARSKWTDGACGHALGGYGASDLDVAQGDHSVGVAEHFAAELNDASGNGVEVLHVVGLELLQQLAQARDEPRLFLTDEPVRVAKFQKDLIICRKGKRPGVSFLGGRRGVFFYVATAKSALTLATHEGK
jgi:hypothetical protein